MTPVPVAVGVGCDKFAGCVNETVANGSTGAETAGAEVEALEADGCDKIWLRS